MGPSEVPIGRNWKETEAVEAMAYGSCRVASIHGSDVAAQKVYFHYEGQIQVHQSQICSCFLAFLQATTGIVKGDKVQVVHLSGC